MSLNKKLPLITLVLGSDFDEKTITIDAGVKGSFTRSDVRLRIFYIKKWNVACDLVFLFKWCDCDLYVLLLNRTLQSHRMGVKPICM